MVELVRDARPERCSDACNRIEGQLPNVQSSGGCDSLTSEEEGRVLHIDEGQCSDHIVNGQASSVYRTSCSHFEEGI